MPKPICDICKQPITTKERMRFKKDKHPTIWVHLGCCFDDWIEKRRWNQDKSNIDNRVHLETYEIDEGEM